MIEQQTISSDELITALADGAALITGNSRLARFILAEFDKKMLLRGLQAWQTPDVLSVKAWLRRVWEEIVLAGSLSGSPQLLSPVQELHLWEFIVKNHSHALLRTQATARCARDTWQLMREWRLDRYESDFSRNEDTVAFAEWASHFDRQCKKNQWLSSSDIPDRLIGLIRHKTWLPENELIWTGFDELSPLMSCMFESLSDAGVQIRYLKIDTNAGQAFRLAAPDVRSEADTISRWVRSCLENDAASRIGIVVPDLASVRTILVNALQRVLVPDSLLPDSDETTLPWNISLGQPLTSYAVIRLAFQLLDLAGNESKAEELGSAIRSPYLAGAIAEAGMRTLLDSKLRKHGEPFVDLKTFSYLLGKYSNSGHQDSDDEQPGVRATPELSRCIHDLQELLGTRPQQASANQWAVWFGKWLKTAGWAMGRTLSSTEYQTVEAWKNMLVDFAGLDTMAGRLTFVAALASLKSMAAARIFQPQSAEVPVQILGLYEAIGLEFDAVWVMGLHDSVWPPAPRPNPFIPVALQIRHSMPHANQARELDVANTITERLSRSAGKIIFSYAQQHDGERTGPSPLIMRFPEIQKQELDLWQGMTWPELVRESGEIENIAVEEVPPLPEQQASGGSAIFKHQSLCPFRAFAEHRLGARPMDAIHPGLDAMQRGRILHKALELFWKQVKSHKQLLEINRTQLEETVREKIQLALETVKGSHPGFINSRFGSIESDRLFEIIMQWLDIEKRRSAFSVISLEKEVNTVVNDVGVHLWIDRIDELDDGRMVIIDYKTGKVAPGGWFGERPDDPQLPLYSVVLEGDIAAVLFGQIRVGDLGYKGIVQESDLIPDLPPAKGNKLLRDATQQWPTVLHEWKQEIERLAQAFRQGDASVNPKNGHATCVSSYCPLTSLCRINEQQHSNDDQHESERE